MPEPAILDIQRFLPSGLNQLSFNAYIYVLFITKLFQKLSTEN